ncbi:MAG: hypothetical protein K0R54_1296 [Clostridiaceae bacterium]|nr:hypothetical protein [Clostridiaceae bacterium]
MKKLFKIATGIILIIIFIIIITSISIYNFGWKSKPVKSDTAIILGCQVYGSVPSPFLMWRCDEGFRLYKEGIVNKIIVSGGKGQGENISEAQAMKEYLISKGMDKANIIIEDKSASTAANLINSKKLMNEYNLKTAVIVSNKYHLKRASLIAKSLDINASYSGVFVTPYKNHEYYGFIREIPALMKYYIVKVYSFIKY